MKYFILYGDCSYQYDYVELEDYDECLQHLVQLKETNDFVIVIKGKQLEIKTNYSLEE